MATVRCTILGCATRGDTARRTGCTTQGWGEAARDEGTKVTLGTVARRSVTGANATGTLGVDAGLCVFMGPRAVAPQGATALRRGLQFIFDEM